MEQESALFGSGILAKAIRQAEREVKMNNGNMTEECLAKIGKLETGFGKLETRIGSLETGFGSLETRIGQVETRIGRVETRIGGLETEVGKLETRIDSLETVIEERFKQSEKHMDKLELGLSELDKFLRGNGKAGVNVRLDRLEKAKNWFLIMAAIVITALLGAFFAHYFELLEK